MDAVEARSVREVRAHARLDRESGRDGDAERGHFRQAGALPAERLLAEAGSLRLPVSEEKDSFHAAELTFPSPCRPRPPKSPPAGRTPAGSTRAEPDGCGAELRRAR